MTFNNYLKNRDPEYYKECGIVRRTFPQLISTAAPKPRAVEMLPIDKIKARIFKKLIGESAATMDNLQKLADEIKVDISKFNPKELKMGFQVEKEHMKDADINVINKESDILKIALAHLRENPNYYTLLKKVEK